MIYGEFFPNPGGRPFTDGKASLGIMRAFWVEVIGTAVLLMVVCGLTDRRNAGRGELLVPLGIGMTVTLLITLIAPLTQGCFNPARDLAPRIFTSMAGWGDLPFTANGQGWWVVYIAAPVCGGLLGAGIHRFLLCPAYERCGKQEV